MTHSVTDCGSALSRASASMRVERRNLLAQPPDASQPGTRNHRVRVIQEHGAVTSLTTHRFVRPPAGITCRRPVQPFQAGPRHGRPAHANPAAAEKSAVQTFYIAGHQHRVTLPGFGKYGESRIAGSSAKTLMGAGDVPRFRTLIQALTVVPYSYLRQKRAGAIAAKPPRSGAQARAWTHPKARNRNHFLICGRVARRVREPKTHGVSVRTGGCHRSGSESCLRARSLPPHHQPAGPAALCRLANPRRSSAPWRSLPAGRPA